VKTLSDALTRIGDVLNILQPADVQPTALQLKAIAEARRAVSAALGKSAQLQTK